MSKFQNLLTKLNINEKHSKVIQKDKVFTKVKDVVIPISDYNFAMDLLELPLTPLGYHYLLVVVDLANNEFDIEPMKDKSASTTLKSFKAMFKRPYIKKPYASITVDGGSEFKSVFAKYCYDESILLRVGIPNRHSQNANVESLNKQLGRLIIGYLNTLEIEKKKVQKNWLPIINTIRQELNKIRKIDLPKNFKDVIPPEINQYDKNGNYIKSKFKVGDMVYYKLDAPIDYLGNKQSTKKFREGDVRLSLTPKKIIKIFTYPGAVLYRYYLEGLPNVSFPESQLRKA